jgi:hypothetical protein
MRRFGPMSFLFVVISISLGGCSAQAGKQAAERTADRFYEAWSRKDWNVVLGLYSAQFYQITGRDQMRHLMVRMHERLGDYKNRKLIYWQVQSGVGKSGQVILLHYQVQYAKGETDERLTLVNDGTEKELKITGHSIKSPLLQGKVSNKPHHKE